MEIRLKCSEFRMNDDLNNKIIDWNSTPRVGETVSVPSETGRFVVAEVMWTVNDPIPTIKIQRPTSS